MRGDLIRRAREARGWTQEELATAVGVGPRTIGNWERGATIPRNRAGKLHAIFGDEISDDSSPASPLAHLSDLDLLAELVRRAVDRERGK
jgi:transcriptional regulator with XRE-family HTH domain